MACWLSAKRFARSMSTALESPAHGRFTRPPTWRSSSECESAKNMELVWVGNWGDEERTRELQEFLLSPASKLVGRARLLSWRALPD